MSQSVHQESFNEEYISAAEICSMIDVSRTTISQSITRGTLPTPIYIGKSNFMLWKRQEVTPALNEWKEQLEARRTKTKR